MKKLFPSLLALMLAFSCFAGCGDPTTSAPDSTPDSTPVEPVEPAHPHESGLDDAKSYLSESLSTKNLKTNREFTLPSTYSFTGETAKYDVAWSVDKTDVVTITTGETEDTFTIAELDEDTPFVLTATITDPEGCHTTTFTLDGVALKAVVPVAITGKPAENTAYKLHVYQASKEVDCYFIGEMSGYYFATSDNYEAGVDIYVEHIADSDAFNVYFMNGETKNYIGVEEAWNSKNSYWTFNIVFNTTAPSSFVWSDDYDTIITTVPCRSDADNENQEATQTSTKTLYLGNYSNFTTFSASTVDKAATSNVGNLVVMTAKKDIVIPDTKKVEDVKTSLNVQLDHKMNKELTLTTTDSRYEDVTVTWAVEPDKGAVLTGNKLALTIPATATTVKLTATIACGETTDTKEFTLNLGPAIVLSETPTQAEIVTAAYQLAEGEELGEFTLEGVISKVKTAYDTTYKNVTVVITIEDKEIECFRMKGEGADVIKAGDTINVTGTLKNYKGTIEFDAGCKLNSYVAGTETPDTPPAGDETAAQVSISFADTANRTTINDNQQIWEQNGIKFTNDKDKSSSNVNGSYSDPIRCYKNSKITVEYARMTKIVFECSTSSYDDFASYLNQALSSTTGITVTVDGTNVTVVFSEEVNSFSVSLTTGKVFLKSITITYNS